jgi:glycosyltransferase involved in cell wall biosynthesis
MVSQGFPKYPGDSTAPFIASIVETLALRGHEIDVVFPHHPEFRYPPGDGFRFVPYRYAPSDRFSPWGFGGSLSGSSRVTPQAALFLPAVLISLRRRVNGLLGAGSYDVVHAHWLLPNGWIASGPARRHRVPLVVSLHGTDVGMAERPFLGRFARSAFAAASGVTAASDDLRRRAIRLGAAPETTQTVHYGVDTALFSPHDPLPTERVALGAKDGELLVVAVGRLLEVKGFRYLIEAVARVEGLHLAIVGDGELRSALERTARDYRVSVTFAGDVDHRRMPELLAAADIVAVPSVVGSAGNTDGLPNTVLEALSTGRPLVASRIGGIPEVVTDRVNGFLTPEKDVNALADALTQLRDDPELRVRIGRQARLGAVRALNWGVAAIALEDAYEAAGSA